MGLLIIFNLLYLPPLVLILYTGYGEIDIEEKRKEEDGGETP